MKNEPPISPSQGQGKCVLCNQCYFKNVNVEGKISCGALGVNDEVSNCKCVSFSPKNRLKPRPNDLFKNIKKLIKRIVK